MFSLSRFRNSVCRSIPCQNMQFCFYYLSLFSAEPSVSSHTPDKYLVITFLARFVARLQFIIIPPFYDSISKRLRKKISLMEKLLRVRARTRNYRGLRVDGERARARRKVDLRVLNCDIKPRPLSIQSLINSQRVLARRYSRSSNDPGPIQSRSARIPISRFPSIHHMIWNPNKFDVYGHLLWLEIKNRTSKYINATFSYAANVGSRSVGLYA